MARKSAVAEEIEEAGGPSAFEEATPTSIFDTITVSTKAGDFKFRELDGDAYDEVVKLATDEESGRVDMIQLLRWLTTESSADGKVGDPKKLNKLPYKVRNQVLAEVNELYFPDDTEELARRLRSLGWTVEAPEGSDNPNS